MLGCGIARWPKIRLGLSLLISILRVLLSYLPSMIGLDITVAYVSDKVYSVCLFVFLDKVRFIFNDFHLLLSYPSGVIGLYVTVTCILILSIYSFIL